MSPRLCSACGKHPAAELVGTTLCAECAGLIVPREPVGTGYADAFGRIWVFNPGGRTVIDGKVVRDGSERRMLQPGETYIDTHGERRTVPS